MAVVPRVYLVGPMGAGKSTIGKILAATLGVAFVDSDRVIEERTGADIPWIFDVEGEAGFRRREAAVIEDLGLTAPMVIATGGGAVLLEENRQSMRRTGTVVYLTASLEQLVERTAKDKKRPLLQVDNPREKIEALILERDPLYRDAADEIVATDRKGPKAVALEIAKRIQSADNN